MHNPFSKKYRRVLTPDEKSKIKKERLIGILAGVFMGLSFPPVPAPFLMFFAFVPYFLVLINKEKLGEINRFTYLTMFFYTIVSIHWVGSWTSEADPFLMISGGALMFFQPCVFLIPTTLYYFASKVFTKRIALYLLPLFWVAFEYLYTVSDFRFPWLTIGNSQAYFTTFIQITDIVGVYGLTIVILYINILLFEAIKPRLEGKRIDPKYIGAAVVLFVIPIIYGQITITDFSNPEKYVKTALIQPDFDPNNRWDGGTLNEQIKTYFELADKGIKDGAELVVMPESALPVYLLAGNNEKEVARFRNFVDTNNVSLLTGMPDATFFFNKEEAPEDAKPLKRSDAVYVSYNSILMFTPNEEVVQKYGKIMLVPFGEKVPYVEMIPILGDIIKWNVGISSWNTGKDIVVFKMPLRNKNSESDSLKIGGVVCIESIYPDFVAQFVQKGAEIITVVTNDSWYGNSSGPYQHKEISVFRAVENRRSVIRAANGGISCLIDPLGRTVDKTELFTRTTLVVDVPIFNTKTFYTTYPLLIPYICLAISLVIALLFIYSRFRKSNNKN